MKSCMNFIHDSFLKENVNVCIKGVSSMKTLNRQMIQTTKRKERILQFGEGNFLRAFIDWQIDKLNKERNFDGGIVVVQPRGSAKIERLNNQNGLFTLYMQGMKNGEAKSEKVVIDSIQRGINLTTDYEDYIKLAENEDIRFVFSNTTEAGIYFEETELLNSRPQQTFPGKFAAFLYARYKAFNGDASKGIIIIPTELIEENGTQLKNVLLKIADLWKLGEDFKTWLVEANIFCNSLVDRIVPGYPVDKAKEFEKELGYKDELLVVAEQYHQWVIEGPKEILQELPLDKIGVNAYVVENLAPYRIQKVRILNGTHTAMTPISILLGLETVAESVNHEIMGPFIKTLIADEIIPTIDFSEEEVKKFSNDVLARFQNPYIKHYLTSISMNSISKYATRNLPTLIDYVNQNNKLPTHLTIALSGLILLYKPDEKFERNDSKEIIQFFNETWGKYDLGEWNTSQVVTAILSNESLWNQDLTQIHGLVDSVKDYLEQMLNLGVKGTMIQLQEGALQ